jgi:hypothetical protein
MRVTFDSYFSHFPAFSRIVRMGNVALAAQPKARAAGAKMMSVFLPSLLNAFIILGLLGGCLATVALVVFNTRGWTERIIRGLTIFTGTLVVMAADATGLTLSSFAVNTFSHGGPVGWAIKLTWVVLGGGAGALLARYLISRVGTGTNLQLRIMILVTVIAHVELLEIYLQNLERNGFIHGIGELPDLAFISGLVLNIVFRFDFRSSTPLGQRPVSLDPSPPPARTAGNPRK